MDGPFETARAWIVERLQAGHLELFTLVTVDGGEVIICPETVTVFVTW